VFDPPPDRLTIPWGYLAILAIVTSVAIAAASGLTIRAARRPSTQALRDL
jgi:putative ABC transport system permease protein